MQEKKNIQDDKEHMMKNLGGNRECQFKKKKKKTNLESLVILAQTLSLMSRKI
jgi:hypothetical protein